MPEDLAESTYGFIYHYYRAEVYRETNWRNRLDVTTNWAIVVTAGILSFAFTNESAPHSLILINTLICWFFLYVESRRFRYYSMLRERTRLLESHLLSPLFKEARLPQSDIWRKALSISLNQPHVTMSRLESIAWRLRRNYIMIITVLFIAWISKIQSYPVRSKSLEQMFTNAQLGVIPGEYVFYAYLVLIAVSIFLAFYIPQAAHEDDLP
jgi:uncharacterized membrane protein